MEVGATTRVVRRDLPWCHRETVISIHTIPFTILYTVGYSTYLSYFVFSADRCLYSIIVCMHACASKLASLHVRGHQDDKRDFEKLCRPAQLNVTADRLATEVLTDLREAGKPRTIYPQPACRAYLRDNIGYITSKEKRSISTELAEYETEVVCLVLSCLA
jgi:hypothetical protein